MPVKGTILMSGGEFGAVPVALFIGMNFPNDVRRPFLHYAKVSNNKLTYNSENGKDC